MAPLVFMILVGIQGLAILTALVCLVMLPFCDITYSQFTGEAAEKIRDCQKELDKMFTL